MAVRRPAEPDRNVPGPSQNGSGSASSWAPVPTTFRSANRSLPRPWEHIFGPLRHGQVDDLVVVGQCGQSIDARIATAIVVKAVALPHTEPRPRPSSERSGNPAPPPEEALR